MSPSIVSRYPSARRSRSVIGLALLALAVAACDGTKQGTSTAPRVVSFSPLDGATNVPLNDHMSAVFDMAMVPLTATTFTLKQGATAVAGAVGMSSDGTIATFTPAANLSAGTVYTATIAAGVAATSGTALAADTSWSFTTGTASDKTAPVVTSTLPANNATGIALNATYSATFSKPMDPLSLTGATFVVNQGATAIAGALVTTGATATFTPSTAIAANTLTTVTLGTGVKDSLGNPLAAPYSWSFTTGKAGTVAPTVISTVPAAAAIGVITTAPLSATFSVNMDPATITAASFTVDQGLTPVTGTVSYAGKTATFTPAAALAFETVYTATLTVAAKDTTGNPLASAFTWAFTTASAANSAPIVVGTFPADLATNVVINTKIAAGFSKAMDATTLTAASFTVKQGATAVAGTVTYGPGNGTTFVPASPLTAGTVYTASISTGAKDTAGTALAKAYTWSFTTGTIADTTPPVVTGTQPKASETGVPTNTKITALFDETMDPTTLTTSSVTLKQGGNLVAGTVVYGPGTSVALTPTALLTASTLYTATITTAAKDAQGNALASNYTWTFTTGASVAKGPAPVGLGAAGNFVILAKTAISTVPASVITGDIGVSPAAATYMTGFSLVADATNVFSRATQITGKAFAANYAVPTPSNLTTAVSNMETAYTDAAGRPTPDFLELGTGNIGGKTLAPGLYKWTSTITMPTDLTISGAATDVWIFQTTGDITMAANKRITLAGGALAKNIFWQVAGKTVIGAGAHFEGILLCKTQVTLETGATMNGRILAQTQVALQQATVTQPAQ